MRVCHGIQLMGQIMSPELWSLASMRILYNSSPSPEHLGHLKGCTGYDSCPKCVQGEDRAKKGKGGSITSCQSPTLSGLKADRS